MRWRAQRVVQPPQARGQVERPHLLGLVAPGEHVDQVVLAAGVLREQQVQPVAGPGLPGRDHEARDGGHDDERQEHGLEAASTEPRARKPRALDDEADERAHGGPRPVAGRQLGPLQPVEERRGLERLEIDGGRHVEHLAEGGVGHLGAERVSGQSLDRRERAGARR